ncbi:hypothetical protein SIO70_15560 [Chitinophaga sancti]|uniref:hypothetical protein n=1 Tax=Chitinophaga sancti TaxID=1004 RepID=UPI002A75E15B|nr:hypothetical protein [Chitinophaga sancti]WPQ66277.1 hypothetical protein SIO70_15560 [Chitinophaga sancti]
MRSLLLILSLCLVNVFAKAQMYDCLNYSAVAIPKNGVKIMTNLPSAGANMMPTLFIQGFGFGNAATINIQLTFYFNSNTFTYPKASNSGTYSPPITLAQENGKVVIFIDSKINYQRFHVSAWGSGLASETAANFAGWTWADTTLFSEATSIKTVPYVNKFDGTVYLPDSITALPEGKFGISTLTPRAPLDVSTTIADTITAVLSRLPEGHYYGRGTMLGVHAVNSTPHYSSSFAIEHYFYGYKNSAINFCRGNSVQGGFMTFSTNDGTEKMRLDASGNLGIGTGTTTLGQYKLTVEGAIGARKLQVTQGAWADFVFAPNYQLPNLYEVDRYIKENRHLPEIPTEKEVKENGVDVGEMNMLLLQKVEELTLYLIEQQKTIDELKKLIQR